MVGASGFPAKCNNIGFYTQFGGKPDSSTQNNKHTKL